MCYFDEVTFTTNVMRKKVCVDILDFSVFSYRAPFDSPTPNYVIYQISSHLVHKQGHYGNIFNFWHIWKKVWGRVINPLWCLKAPSPATKKWIFEFCTKFGFTNHLQTFWPRQLVKSELSLGLNVFKLNM